MGDNVGIRLSLIDNKLCCDKSRVSIKLELFNDGADDFYISKNEILFDGFKDDKFNIVSIDEVVVPYVGRLVNYVPDLLHLQAHQVLSKELNLAEAYAFSDSASGQYLVSFSTMLFLCKDNTQVSCMGVEKNANLTIQIC